jgi:cytochrome c-type biogenesis protein CcsB
MMYLSRLNLKDWSYAGLLLVAALLAFVQYAGKMNRYEEIILAACVPATVWLGWQFKPLRWFVPAVGLLSLWAIQLYGGDLSRNTESFWLKYFIASQSAILWMCALYFLATFMYWVGLIARSNTAAQMASWFTWAATLMGFVGLMVRWYESHQMGPGMGYIPVSNLYEVFVLFCLVTALFYLYYELKYETRALGGFVLLIITAAVGFLLWYTFDRNAHEIQPLVPALQSWWMKIHVPANFIGYGTFSIAAMVAFAYLIKQNAETSNWLKLAPLFVFGVLLAMEPLIFRFEKTSNYWMLYFAVAVTLSGAIIGFRRRIAAVLPDFEVLDDIMYKAIAVGFAFFTVATILGALWAAEAWGAYWQWDPKETWALIVWLNYAAWLHLRLMKGLRGTLAAYWALVGLLITGFAFLGVNMFLSGLHSYGEL